MRSGDLPDPFFVKMPCWVSMKRTEHMRTLNTFMAFSTVQGFITRARVNPGNEFGLEVDFWLLSRRLHPDTLIGFF